ncbi:MAG: GNAT family N-acetyltransferase [Planctomycetota bacterium]
MHFRQRVIVYVHRTAADGELEFACFENPTWNTPHMPAGGVDDGETLAEAAIREVAEEVGIALTDEPRRIKATLWRYSQTDTWCIQHYMAVAAPDGLPTTWRHVMQNECEHTGTEVACSWLPFRHLNSLPDGQGAGGIHLQPTNAKAASANVKLREATPADAAFIIALRNHAIATSAAIYSDEPLPPDAMDDAFENGRPAMPMLIAEVDGHHAGYGSLAKYNRRTGFARTVENSVYVHDDFQGKGVGGAILDGLIDAGRAAGFHTIVARVDTGQQPSLGLHLSRGFVPVGVIREAGFKFGDWRDAAYLQKMLS